VLFLSVERKLTKLCFDGCGKPNGVDAVFAPQKAPERLNRPTRVSHSLLESIRNAYERNNIGAEAAIVQLDQSIPGDQQIGERFDLQSQ
jgi:hypothetical protein